VRPLWFICPVILRRLLKTNGATLGLRVRKVRAWSTSSRLPVLVAVKRGGTGVSCSAASRYLRTVNAIRLMPGPVMLPFTLMSNAKV
jgi:hypothetical protein